MCWRTLRRLRLLLWRRRTIVAEAWRALWRRRGRWRGLSVSSPWTSSWWLLALALWGPLLGTTRASLLIGRTLGLPSGLEVRSLHRLLLLLWGAHSWVAGLLRRSLAHMKWVSSIRVLTRLSRPNHHLREAHLLLRVPLHRLHMGMLHSLLLSIYQLLLRRRRMGRLGWIELVMPTGGEGGSSSLHDIVWGGSAMLMWLRLISRMTSSSW